MPNLTGQELPTLHWFCRKFPGINQSFHVLTIKSENLHGYGNLFPITLNVIQFYFAALLTRLLRLLDVASFSSLVISKSLFLLYNPPYKLNSRNVTEQIGLFQASVRRLSMYATSEPRKTSLSISPTSNATLLPPFVDSHTNGVRRIIVQSHSKARSELASLATATARLRTSTYSSTYGRSCCFRHGLSQ